MDYNIRVWLTLSPSSMSRCGRHATYPRPQPDRPPCPTAAEPTYIHTYNLSVYTTKSMLLKNYFQPRSEKSQLQRSCEEVGFPMKEAYIHTVHERKIRSWERIHSLHTYIQYIVLTFYSVWVILFAFLSLCFASAATRCQLVVATAFFCRHSMCGWNISYVYVCMYVG